MPRHVKSPERELLELSARSTVTFRDRLVRLARAIYRGDRDEEKRQFRLFHELLAQTMILADLLGRRRLLLEVDAKAGRQPEDLLELELFAETPIIPEVPFLEAIRDFVTREPRLAEVIAGEPLWRAVARLYQEGQHVFSLAAAARLFIERKGREAIELTRDVKIELARAFQEGASREATKAALDRLHGFSGAYAETVFRTNLNTSFTAGRWQQAKSPEARRVFGAFEYNAVLDSDVRPNHAAANGLIAAFDDPIWNTFSPPTGYNCRCTLLMVDRLTLRERGLLDGDTVLRFEPPGFAEAHPDEGFGRIRADKPIYG